MRYTLLILGLLLFRRLVNAQADNEIQVDAAPGIQQNWTIFELHSNYSFKGSQLPGDRGM